MELVSLGQLEYRHVWLALAMYVYSLSLISAFLALPIGSANKGPRSSTTKVDDLHAFSPTFLHWDIGLAAPDTINIRRWFMRMRTLRNLDPPLSFTPIVHHSKMNATCHSHVSDLRNARHGSLTCGIPDLCHNGVLRIF